MTILKIFLFFSRMLGIWFFRVRKIIDVLGLKLKSIEKNEKKAWLWMSNHPCFPRRSNTNHHYSCKLFRWYLTSKGQIQVLAVWVAQDGASWRSHLRMILIHPFWFFLPPKKYLVLLKNYLFNIVIIKALVTHTKLSLLTPFSLCSRSQSKI